MFRKDRERSMPGIAMPNPEGFPLGGTVAPKPIVPPLRSLPTHPRPYQIDAFAGDRLLSECETPPVVLQAEPPDADLGFDVTKCIVEVPIARFVEIETDQCLRGLESLGFRVDRSKGASAIDMVRCLRATHALRGGFEQILFIDSDMKFDPLSAIKLFAMPEPVVAGVYAAKVLGKGSRVNVVYEDSVESVRYGDWADGTTYPVRNVGAGFLRIKTSALREMITKLDLPLCRMGDGEGYPFFMPFWRKHDGDALPRYHCEDYAFCTRCRDAGIQPVVDTSFRLYHIGDYPYGLEEASGDYIKRSRDLEAVARPTANAAKS